MIAFTAEFTIKIPAAMKYYGMPQGGFRIKSKKISNDQELIQSDPISCPKNQKGNN